MRDDARGQRPVGSQPERERAAGVEMLDVGRLVGELAVDGGGVRALCVWFMEEGGAER